MLALLPYDVLHEIFKNFTQQSDHQTLQALSVTCKTLHESVAPLLWRSIWLPLENNVQLTLGACAAITSVASRASFVRTLVCGGIRDIPPLLQNTYGDSSTQESGGGPFPPIVSGSPTVEMERALRMLTNLEHIIICFQVYLQTSYPYSFTSVLDSLASNAAWPPRTLHPTGPTMRMPFLLRKITIEHCAPGLIDFLREQPMIEELDTGRRYDAFRELATTVDGPIVVPPAIGFLPNLRKITGHPRLVGQFLQGRPHITEVTLTKLYFYPPLGNIFHFLFPVPVDDIDRVSHLEGLEPIAGIKTTPELQFPAAACFPSIRHLKFQHSVPPPPRHGSTFNRMVQYMWMEDPRAFESILYIEASPIFARSLLLVASDVGTTKLDWKEAERVADMGGRWTQGQGDSALVRISKTIQPDGSYLWMPVEPPW
ncbi:hypothetical protein DL93DRAFT_778294 [Clavulina sp. PMI_390]|nr:hypothetical protein DL93DRAFT_778294 [Clavulina sp. PMI_390]